jgi:hypothetical protein
MALDLGGHGPGRTRPLGLAVAIWALLPCVAHGPSAWAISEQYQFWGSLNSTTRLTDRLGVIADVHVRRNDFLAEPSFDFLRLGVHCWATEKLTLTLGYAPCGPRTTPRAARSTTGSDPLNTAGAKAPRIAGAVTGRGLRMGGGGRAGPHVMSVPP